ncbi:MAG: DUF4190 domain-containing protein [Pirellulales bacterium]|nr:DUF4190 domain-containing protein [Pirellulales bacterium]
MSQDPTQNQGPNPFSAPMPMAQPVAHQAYAIGEGDATGGVIPYKNPAALVAYYLGLFSWFPFLGLFLAIPAFILGMVGLAKRKQNPAIKGSVHAWIGIVMGAIFTVVWGLLSLMMIAAIIAA